MLEERRVGIEWWVGGILIACLIGIPIVHSIYLNSAEGRADEAARAHNEREQAAAFAGARRLQAMLRDPESLEIASAIVMEDGRVVCYEYRAKNGFGGFNASHAVVADDRFYDESQDAFSAIWRARCAGHHGDQMASNLTAVLRQDY